MDPSFAVELKVTPESYLCFPAVSKVSQVDVLVLQRAPQTFDEHVVQRTPSSIHADRHAARDQTTGELHRRELKPLVAVEQFRATQGESVVQRFQAEAPVERAFV